MSCDGIRLEDHALGFLDGRERADVERHLATCAACRSENEQVRHLVARLEELPTAVPRSKKRTLEVLAMTTAACLMLGWLAWFIAGQPQDPAPAKTQDPPRAREIDALVERLGHTDVEERDKAEKAIRALAKDLEHALAALEKARASSDSELKLRAERAAAGLLEDVGRILKRQAATPLAGARSREELQRALAVVEQKPHSADKYLERSDLHLELDEPARALEDAQNALKLDLRRADAYLAVARARCALRQYDAGIADCSHAIELNPAWPKPYLLRARARLIQKAFESAMEDCTRAIALDPLCAEAFMLRTQARHALGDKVGALEDSKEYDRLKAREKR